MSSVRARLTRPVLSRGPTPIGRTIGVHQSVGHLDPTSDGDAGTVFTEPLAKSPANAPGLNMRPSEMNHFNGARSGTVGL